MPDYSPVTPSIIDEIQSICGTDAVFTDEKHLEKYSHDQVSAKKYTHAPEVVVMPRTAEQAAAVIKLANREKIPVTPRGAGSGLSGGAVPLYGGICLSCEKMDRIIEVDTANLVVVAEPGVVTTKLDEALQPHGLFFAGYPMSEEFCFLGGNVAENAGGGRAIKYGVVSRYITGLEVVTPTGDIVQLGGKRVKDVTGYDLIRLMTGSEGTLGFFTKIFIKLLPRPVHRISSLVLFKDVPSAIGTVPRIMTGGGFLPTSIEFMDRICLYETCKALKETIDYEQAGAMMLFEVDGTNEAEVRSNADYILACCKENGAVNVYPAATPEESDRFWKIRKRVPWTIKRLSEHQSLEDIVVPIAAIPDMLSRLHLIGERHGIRIPTFGHAGDGNLHAVPIKNENMAVDEWEKLLPAVLEDIYRAARDLGGTISGEHGIGHKRKKYMGTVMEPAQLELFKKIKRALDPGGIMNPGKIFDL